MRHSTVPVFVPFAGCPQRCVYCDQRSIAATAKTPDAAQVTRLLEAACDKSGSFTPDAQIAFFGGSFTALPEEQMIGLLAAARPFVRSGPFASIRLSTRPDAISARILSILRDYDVRTVELGAQSADDGVLAANRRGHTFADTVRASEAIRGAGLELVLQMMTGMYGGTADGDLQTAERLLALSPDAMRVYPTTVLEGTELAALWRAGKYLPPTLEETVEVCAAIRAKADAAGVPIIRMGLHSELKSEDVLAGPYHPAFGELVESRLWLSRLTAELNGRPCGKYTLRVAPECVSAAVGHAGCNRESLRADGYFLRVKPDPALKRQALILTKEDSECS